MIDIRGGRSAISRVTAPPVNPNDQTLRYDENERKEEEEAFANLCKPRRDAVSERNKEACQPAQDEQDLIEEHERFCLHVLAAFISIGGKEACSSFLLKIFEQHLDSVINNTPDEEKYSSLLFKANLLRLKALMILLTEEKDQVELQNAKKLTDEAL